LPWEHRAEAEPEPNPPRSSWQRIEDFMTRYFITLASPMTFAWLVSFSASAQDACVEFMENHLQDAAWEKACIDSLDSLSQASAPSTSALGQQGSQSMSMGFAMFDGPVNISETSCDGVPKYPATDENEPFIAIDPNDSMIQFAISKHEVVDGLFAAYSTDGGVCWNPSIIASSEGGSLGLGGGDPWAVFDESGHLYIAYLSISTTPPPATRLVWVAKSADGGQSFTHVAKLGFGFTDRPTLAIGAGDGMSATASLWVTYQQLAPTVTIVVQKAAIDSAGDLINDYCAVGDGLFCQAEPIATDTAPSAYPDLITGDVAVGPSGEVLALSVTHNGQLGQSTFQFARDDDGLGPNPFSAVGPSITTNVGFLQGIPPRSNITRQISPVPTFAWDLSTERHGDQGRVHLVYTEEVVDGFYDTDIVWTYSDDAGDNWHMPCPEDPPGPLNCMGGDRTGPDPIRVNDDLADHSQFLPAIAVDQTTGDVAVSWYDPRDDPQNLESHLYFAAVRNDEEEFLTNVRISTGASLATSLENSQADYMAIAFQDDVAYPVWVDNSSSVAGDFDPYTAQLIPEPNVAAQMLAGMLALMGLSALRPRAR
jgi:hypothetical protein